MRRSVSSLSIALATAFALALAGCASTSEDESQVSDFDQGDVSEQEVTVVEETVEDTTVSAAVELKNIYFDFDRSNIRADQRDTAGSNGNQIKMSGASIRLEGHTDERGDEEYNLALGERRANAVKSYLENMGVSASQLRTVSYGEAKPAVQGHDESAWKWNRRVEFRQR